MLAYPGIAPLTVATSGATVGVLVTSGSGDAYGWWPTPLVVNGNDARSAANLMAAVEGLTDRTNFLGEHMIDWTRGGTWATWAPGVAWGGHLSIDHSPTADGATGLAAKGGSVNGPGLDGFAGGGNAFGTRGTGSGTGPGVIGVAGGSAGTPGVKSSGGPLYIDTDIAAGSAPGAGKQYAGQIVKAWALIHVNGSGGATLTDNINVSAVAIFSTAVRLTFGTAFANATFAMTATVITPNASPVGAFASEPHGTRLATQCEVSITDLAVSAVAYADLASGGVAYDINVEVVGRQ